MGQDGGEPGGRCSLAEAADPYLCAPTLLLLAIHRALYASSGLQRGVTKLKRLLEGQDEPQFDADLYMQLYT